MILGKKTDVLMRCPMPTVPITTLGDLFVKHRLQAGLKQSELAMMLGIPRMWLGRWERGRCIPTQSGWLKLQTALALPDYQAVLPHLTPVKSAGFEDSIQNGPPSRG